MFDNVDYSKIPIFLTAADCLNFTEAANRLLMTQSSLSKAIANFEAAVGFPLFVRGNRKVTLTPEGAYLHLELSYIMSKASDVIRNASWIHSGYTGKFRIGTAGYLAKTPAFQRICSLFCESFPMFDIELTQMEYPELRRRLFDDQVDAILFNQHDLSVMHGFFTLPIMHGEPILLCNKNIKHPHSGKDLSIQDFRDYKFVCLDKKTTPSYFSYMSSCCEANGFKANISNFVPTLIETINYIGTANVVTIMDSTLFPLDNPDLQIIPIPWKEGMSKLDTIMVWNIDNQNKAFKYYISFAEEMIGCKARII